MTDELTTEQAQTETTEPETPEKALEATGSELEEAAAAEESEPSEESGCCLESCCELADLDPENRKLLIFEAAVVLLAGWERRPLEGKKLQSESKKAVAAAEAVWKEAGLP